MVSFIQIWREIMVVIILAGAGGGLWLIYRIARDTRHSIPRNNDDMVFF
jgi:uncharacterized protein YneF (UPF0154 family)